MVKIKYLVMDVDGTLTDGKIYISPSGEAMKAFNIKDGCGIHDVLIPAGIVPIIISGRKSEIVVCRAKELGISHVYQGVIDKVQCLREVANNMSEVAYIGDDINDLSCIKVVSVEGGITACPSDAVDKVKNEVDFVSNYKGGDGAVRDFIEYLVDVFNKQ